MMFSTFDEIKKLAKQRGMTLTQVETALNYSYNTLYKIKTHSPSCERIKEIADFFDVSTDQLLGRKTKEPSFASQFQLDTSDLTNEEKAELEDELGAMVKFITQRFKEKKKEKTEQP